MHVHTHTHSIIIMELFTNDCWSNSILIKRQFILSLSTNSLRHKSCNHSLMSGTHQIAITHLSLNTHLLSDSWQKVFYAYEQWSDNAIIYNKGWLKWKDVNFILSGQHPYSETDFQSMKGEEIQYYVLHSFWGFMYTFLLILWSTVCSPLLVRYCAIEMTTIIITHLCIEWLQP